MGWIGVPRRAAWMLLAVTAIACSSSDPSEPKDLTEIDASVDDAGEAAPPRDALGADTDASRAPPWDAALDSAGESATGLEREASEATDDASTEAIADRPDAWPTVDSASDLQEIPDSNSDPDADREASLADRGTGEAMGEAQTDREASPDVTSLDDAAPLDASIETGAPDASNDAPSGSELDAVPTDEDAGMSVPQTCRSDTDCGPGFYCSFIGAYCHYVDAFGVGNGYCAAVPTDCDPQQGGMACGCDGKLYCNGCFLAMRRLSSAMAGLCAPPNTVVCSPP